MWEIQEHYLLGKTYGLIYVHECEDKPIMCIKNWENGLKEGDIYYRYRGRSERIKFPELRNILENKRSQEQRLWMRHLSEIARIGVREAGIFDPQSGQIAGSTGSFLIDESLLSQLSFVKEGTSSEGEGKPVLKIVGEAKVVSGLPYPTTRKSIVSVRGIRTSDIVLSFLAQEKVQEPREYITQICFENSAYLPVHFFMHLARLSLSETIALLNAVICRSATKQRLLGRLQNGLTQSLAISGRNTPLAEKKRRFVQQLIRQQVSIDIGGEDLEYTVQSIRGLTQEQVRQDDAYLRNLLRTWFNRHYASPEATLADYLRRAICWVDEALYKDK